MVNIGKLACSLSFVGFFLLTPKSEGNSIKWSNSSLLKMQQNRTFRIQTSLGSFSTWRQWIPSLPFSYSLPHPPKWCRDDNGYSRLVVTLSISRSNSWLYVSLSGATTLLQCRQERNRYWIWGWEREREHMNFW